MPWCIVMLLTIVGIHVLNAIVIYVRDAPWNKRPTGHGSWFKKHFVSDRLADRIFCFSLYAIAGVFIAALVVALSPILYFALGAWVYKKIDKHHKRQGASVYEITGVSMFSFVMRGVAFRKSKGRKSCWPSAG